MKKMLKILPKDYRHYLCLLISLGFVLLSILCFPNAFTRLLEAGRDVGLSAAYYVTELFFTPGTVTPTVTDFSSVPLLDLLPLPENFEAFSEGFPVYLQSVFSSETFFSYLLTVADGLYIVSQVLLLLMPLFAVLVIAVHCILHGHNNDYARESRPLRIGKRIYDVTYRPVRDFIVGFIGFCGEHRIYLYVWIFIWAYNFNFITILLEAFAFYLYFVISFDFVLLYTQVCKLVLDLMPMLSFIPAFLWAILALVICEYLARKYGMRVLRHRERRNRGFLNERGVLTTVYGEMNAGKTAMITDISLSAEAQFRDMAFEILVECDLCFPHLPWILLENELRRAMEHHEVYDKFSCKEWVKKKRRRFEKSPCKEKIFGYDYERYGTYHDNKLKNEYVWETVEDYAAAFMIYITSSALILANYSIRVDDICHDVGNFPRWDTDFFRRDSRFMEAYSRHCHILDFDMMRLGKRMIEENPQAFAFGFGVYVISEIDKERKNTPELRDVKASAEEANQKNDLFNTLLKMSRHNCVIRNRVFIKILADLQRPESLGGDARELGEVVYIDKKGDMLPTLPFFAPFYFFELLYGSVFSRFVDTYYDYRYNRGDDILLIHAYKSIAAKLKHIHDNTNNLYGSQAVSLLVESGRMNGKPKRKKYFMQAKKSFSERYGTDCQSGIFERRARYNRIGLDDIKEYLGKVATWEELSEQHSFFQEEVSRLEKGGVGYGIQRR